MKIDSQEMREVRNAGEAAQDQPPRFDMYVGIHKALRALMADTLLAVGRMDADDDLECAQVTQRVVELLDFHLSLLSHENKSVHTAFEARAPSAIGRIAHEHEGHGQHIAELRHAVEAVRGSHRRRVHRGLSCGIGAA